MAIDLGPDGLTLGSTTINDWANVGGGKVLQVVQDVMTNAVQYNAGAWQDTALSLSITPSATSSKILLMCTISLGTDTNAYAHARFVRNGSTYILGDTNGSSTRATFSVSGNTTHHTKADTRGMNHLDSPNTTSAITYKLQVYDNNDWIRINKEGENFTGGAGGGAYVSTLIAMEIGA